MPNDISHRGLPPLEEMDREWHAWHQVVDEWRANPLTRDIDFNDAALNPVMRAIELWGEHLAAMRLEQDADVRNRALKDRTEAYHAVATVEPRI